MVQGIIISAFGGVKSEEIEILLKNVKKLKKSFMSLASFASSFIYFSDSTGLYQSLINFVILKYFVVTKTAFFNNSAL